MTEISLFHEQIASNHFQSPRDRIISPFLHIDLSLYFKVPPKFKWVDELRRILSGPKGTCTAADQSFSPIGNWRETWSISVLVLLSVKDFSIEPYRTKVGSNGQRRPCKGCFPLHYSRENPNFDQRRHS
ncbi:MAG: hypothetical protein AAGJ91_07480 [Pseudomonadota bacterium]